MNKNVCEKLQPGLIGCAEVTVAQVHTAASMGSGRMPVLATPAMIVLMEAAAQAAIDQLLPEECQTVGTRLDVRHHGATPIGVRVVAQAELTAVDGRNLTFRVTVRDDKELIGDGVHERTIFALASFERMLRQKTKRQGGEFPSTDSAARA